MNPMGSNSQGQNGQMPSQGTYSSLLSPHNHYDDLLLLEDMPNDSLMINQSFENNTLELDQVELLEGFKSHFGIDSGGSQQTLAHPDHHMVRNQQLYPSQLQQQPVPQHPAQQFCKLTQPMQQFCHLTNQEAQPMQQFQSVRSSFDRFSPVTVGPQQLQQQHLHQMPWRSSLDSAVTQLNGLQHQKVLQTRQNQQPRQIQLLRPLNPCTPHMQRQFPSPNGPFLFSYNPICKLKTCLRRLDEYKFHQRNGLGGKNSQFWRKFVSDFFTPDAKMRWCVSLYGRVPKITDLDEILKCKLCNSKRGLRYASEATFETLPRLFKVKYESGMLEEHLHVGALSHVYYNPVGELTLTYERAVQESVFEQRRVLREGRLRIIFSPDYKIYSWDFCAVHHEVFIPRRLLIEQVNQLTSVAQQYQTCTQNPSSNLSDTDLQIIATKFMASARGVANTLEVPQSLDELGHSDHFVQCLEVTKVCNMMKDLIDFNLDTGASPTETYFNLPKRRRMNNGSSSGK